MPFFYEVFGDGLTVADTVDTSFMAFLSAAQWDARIVSVRIGSRIIAATRNIRISCINRPTTAPSAISSLVRTKRHPDNQAMKTAVGTTFTVGTGGPNLHFSISSGDEAGIATPGEWRALNMDHAVTLKAGGGTPGNAELMRLASSSVSKLYDVSTELAEDSAS